MFTAPLAHVRGVNAFCPPSEFERNLQDGGEHIARGFAPLLPETASADLLAAESSAQITHKHGNLTHEITRYTRKSNQKRVLLSYDKRGGCLMRGTDLF